MKKEHKEHQQEEEKEAEGINMVKILGLIVVSNKQKMVFFVIKIIFYYIKVKKYWYLEKVTGNVLIRTVKIWILLEEQNVIDVDRYSQTIINQVDIVVVIIHRNMIEIIIEHNIKHLEMIIEEIKNLEIEVIVEINLVKLNLIKVVILLLEILKLKEIQSGIIMMIIIIQEEILVEIIKL